MNTKITWWDRFKHKVFGSHIPGKSYIWYPPNERDYDCFGEYAKCEICGKEIVLRTPY